MPSDSTFIHATAVVMGEAGVVIRGPSGAGKSSLALGLLAADPMGKRYVSLVGDDRISIECRGGRLIARGHPLIAGQIECRGRGIRSFSYEPSAVVRLIVDIAPSDQVLPRYPESGCSEIVLCGIKVPLLILPRGNAIHESSLAVLVELAKAREF
jgi:serine kinase of HPr protein (carbohydrate metabolism regulator)